MGKNMNMNIGGFHGKMGSEQTQTVTATSKDALVCLCGSDKFVSLVNIFKITTGIVGANEGVIPKSLGFKCSNCDRIADKQTKTRRDIENEVKLREGVQSELPFTK